MTTQYPTQPDPQQPQQYAPPQYAPRRSVNIGFVLLASFSGLLVLVGAATNLVANSLYGSAYTTWNVLEYDDPGKSSKYLDVLGAGNLQQLGTQVLQSGIVAVAILFATWAILIAVKRAK